MVKLLGLTGSIATGKSFVAKFFEKNNINIFLCDDYVASLFSQDMVIEKLKSNDILSLSIKNNHVDKDKLSSIVFKDVVYLDQLEEIILPLVHQGMMDFVNKNYKEKAILLEIPLLFECGYEKICDKIITTFCSYKTQENRVINRPNMNKDKFEFILKRQRSITEKSKLSNFLVYTDISYNYTEKQIKQILAREGL